MFQCFCRKTYDIVILENHKIELSGVTVRKIVITGRCEMNLCIKQVYSKTIGKRAAVFVSKKILNRYEPRREKNRLFAYAKTKTQISFAITAKLISAFVFAT